MWFRQQRARGLAHGGGEFTIGELADATADLTRLDRAQVYKNCSVLLCGWVNTMKLNKRQSDRGMLYKKTGLWGNTAPEAPQPSSGVAKNYAEFRAQIKTAPAEAQES